VGKKNKKGNKILRKLFMLHHCYEVLGNEDKWKTRGKLDAATIATNATGEATIIDDDDSSEEGKKRSSTPHSVNNARRNVLGRKAAKDMKGKKAGDDDIAVAMDRFSNARFQANEDRKAARNLEQESMEAMEARRVALEERLAANEERKLALEEKKLANEEHQRLVEEDRKLFFMDTSNMDERQKEYINLARDEVLAKKNVGNQHEHTYNRLWRLCRHGCPGGCLWRPLWRRGSAGGHVWRRHGRHVRHGRHCRNRMGRGMGLGGFGGVFGGTSAPMAGMGAPAGGVYGAMGAPPGGFVASMDSSLPPSTHGADEEGAKHEDAFENVDV
jgi:hypothetical protein